MTEITSRPLYNGNHRPVRTMLEWRRLAANRKVRRMAASIPNTNTAPVLHFTPNRSRYQLILLGEQRHTCVNTEQLAQSCT